MSWPKDAEHPLTPALGKASDRICGASKLNVERRGDAILCRQCGGPQ